MERLLPIVLAAVAFAAPAAEAEPDVREEAFIHEVRIGVLQHDIGIWGSGSVEDGVALNGELAFRALTPFLGGKVRPVIGASVSTEGRTDYAYADARWEYLWNRLFLGIGLGAAIHDSDLGRERRQKDLGSRVLFHVPVELGYQFTPSNRVSVYFEHVSNAWLGDPNPGMDNIGVRLSHRF